MTKDSVSREHFKARRDKSNTLYNDQGMERASIDAGAEVSKYLQQIKDLGVLTKEQAAHAKTLLAERRDASEAVRAEKIKILTQRMNTQGLTLKELGKIQKELNRVEDSTANFDNYARDLAKIERATDPGATLQTLQKKAQAQASRLLSVNNAILPRTAHAVTNAREAALKVSSGTQMYDLATRGLWSTGKTTSTAPMSSAPLISKDLAAAISKTAPTKDLRRVLGGSHAKHNESIAKAKSIVQSPQNAVFYDFETVGRMGKEISPIEFAMSYYDQAGKKVTDQKIMQMTTEQSKYIEGLMSKLSKGDSDKKINPYDNSLLTQ